MNDIAGIIQEVIKKPIITIEDINNIISNTKSDDAKIYILQRIKEGKGRELKLLSYVIAYEESKGNLSDDTIVNLDDLNKELNEQIEECNNCELTSFDFCSSFSWMEDLVETMNKMYEF